MVQPVDGNAAMSLDGDSVRGGTLVQQAFPRRVSCPGGVESSTPRVPQKNLTPNLRRDCVGFARSHY